MLRKRNHICRSRLIDTLFVSRCGVRFIYQPVYSISLLQISPRGRITLGITSVLFRNMDGNKNNMIQKLFDMSSKRHQRSILIQKYLTIWCQSIENSILYLAVGQGRNAIVRQMNSSAVAHTSQAHLRACVSSKS